MTEGSFVMRNRRNGNLMTQQKTVTKEPSPCHMTEGSFVMRNRRNGNLMTQQKTVTKEPSPCHTENELRKEHSIPVRTHYAIYKDGTAFDDSYIRDLIPSVRRTYPFGNIFHRRYFNNW